MFVRALAFGWVVLIVSSLPRPGPAAPVAAQTTIGGRVLASARGQVAWLDLLAPRPTPLTQLVRPAYPADVAATPGVPFAVASYITAAYWFTASTSFANPAVTIARVLSDTFAGIRPTDAPLFIVAQLAGALAATFLFAWLVPSLPTHAQEVLVPHPGQGP